VKIYRIFRILRILKILRILRILQIVLFVCFLLPYTSEACNITVYPVQFGDYSGARLQTRGEIVVENCATTPIKIKLNAGRNSNGSFTKRNMRSNYTNSVIRYNLYLDPKHKIIWGNGFGGSKVLHAGEGRYIIYAQVPANQLGKAGRYHDRIEIIIEW